MSAELERIRTVAGLLRQHEKSVDGERSTLHVLMRRARDAGATDTAIAEAAGITKGRVGQILGARKPRDEQSTEGKR